MSGKANQTYISILKQIDKTVPNTKTKRPVRLEELDFKEQSSNSIFSNLMIMVYNQHIMIIPSGYTKQGYEYFLAFILTDKGKKFLKTIRFAT